METLKRAPNATEFVALHAANKAATEVHEKILEHSNAGATQYVDDSVVEAAKTAYLAAGGERQIVVKGYGNSTHPVIDIKVFLLKKKQGE